MGNGLVCCAKNDTETNMLKNDSAWCKFHSTYPNSRIISTSLCIQYVLFMGPGKHSGVITGSLHFKQKILQFLGFFCQSLTLAFSYFISHVLNFLTSQFSVCQIIIKRTRKHKKKFYSYHLPLETPQNIEEPPCSASSVIQLEAHTWSTYTFLVYTIKCDSATHFIS